MICEREKYFLSYFIFRKQKKEEIPSSKLSSDTKGQPVVLLPRYKLDPL